MTSAQTAEWGDILTGSSNYPSEQSVVIGFSKVRNQDRRFELLRVQCVFSQVHKAAIGLLIANSERFTPIQLEYLNGFCAANRPAIRCGIKARDEISRRWVKIDKGPRIVIRWIHQQGYPILQRKLGPFESSTFSAAEQQIRPLKHSVGVAGLWPEVFDVGAVGIAAIHAALAFASHRSQHVQCGFQVPGSPS